MGHTLVKGYLETPPLYKVWGVEMYAANGIPVNQKTEPDSVTYGLVSKFIEEVINGLDPKYQVYDPQKITIRAGQTNGNGLYGIEARASNKQGEIYLDVLVSEGVEHLEPEKLFAAAVAEVAGQGPHLARRKYPEKARDWLMPEYEKVASPALQEDAKEYEKKRPDSRYSLQGGYTIARMPGSGEEYWYPDNVMVLLLDHRIDNGQDLRKKFEKEIDRMALARDIHAKENYSLGGYSLGLLVDGKEAKKFGDSLSSTIDTLWDYIETIEGATPKIVRHISVGYNRAIIKPEGNGTTAQLDSLFTRIMRLSAARTGLEAGRKNKTLKDIDEEFRQYVIEKGPIALLPEKIIPVLEKK